MVRDRLSQTTLGIIILASVVAAFLASGCAGKDPADQVAGRWDVTIEGPRGPYPSWFEISSEEGVLSGSFVGRSGSARPIKSISLEKDQLTFSLPKQYEGRETDLTFKGVAADGKITGEADDRDGNPLKFTAVRAPELPFRENVVWGEPIKLIGEDLSNWSAMRGGEVKGWEIKGGILRNTPPTVNLVTRDKYTDFKLHAEYKVPERGNSGIYLRGRHEVQVAADHGREPNKRSSGSIYGFITPAQPASNPTGEWNSYDITLIGRWVTVEFNGIKIIDNAEIPGITGGAIDSREGEPGPIMLQGDHQQVDYRNVILTPVE
jgi:hypothetical protein